MLPPTTSGRGLIAVVVLAWLLGGCESPPREDLSSEPETAKETTEPEPNESQTGYWIRHDVPGLGSQGIRKVAITEFVVEMVTSRYETHGEGPPQSIRTEFGGRLLQEIPDQLYTAFVQHLQAFDLSISTREAVTGAQAYGLYEVATGAVDRRQSETSDLGRVRSSKLLSARGLGRLEGAREGDVEDVDAALLEELGADLVVRAHFRVGIYEGRATVESGSAVTLTSKTILGSLVAVRSILSDKSALADGSTKPNPDGVYEVEYDRFSLIMRFHFDRALKLGFEELH